MGRKQLSTKDFIERGRSIHGDRYIYDKTVYTSSSDPLVISCRIHGDFLQYPGAHYRGRGKGTHCYDCSLITRARIKRRNALSKKYENIIQPEGYKIIPLGQNKTTIVDNDDFYKVRHLNWFYLKNGYAYNNLRGYLHIFINGLPPGDLETDHKDKNKLNNRKSNLRQCPKGYNTQNKKRDSASGFTGVHVSGKRGLWECRICKERKVYRLGYFKDKVRAAKEYDKKAKQLYGKDAHVNFPETKKGV